MLRPPELARISPVRIDKAPPVRPYDNGYLFRTEFRALSEPPDSPNDNDDDVLIPESDLNLPVVATPKSRDRLRQSLSWLSLALGLGLTVVIAVVGSQGKSIDLTSIIALTVVSGIFQVASVIVGNSGSKLDPTLVRAVSRRLLKAHGRAAAATHEAEIGYENARSAKEKVVLGKLSVELSLIDEHLIDSIETWRDLRPDLFRSGDDT